MNLNHRLNLIPRNNWDYGLDALASAAYPAPQTPALEALFGRAPIWTNTGRAALYAILKALELPPGAEVGVPLFCCSVVFNAIQQAGLKPRFLDVHPHNGNLAPADLRRKRAGLAAVVAVHMFGHPCDLDAIQAEAGTIPVIEDCAQSLFSTYHGRPTGLLSMASFFSFRCGKYISAGEGSAIFCQDPALRARVEQVVGGFAGWSMPEMLVHALSTFAKATLYNRPWYGLVGYPVGMRLDKKLNLTAKDGFETGQIAATHLALIEARVAGFREKIERQRVHAQQLLSLLEAGPFGLPAEGEGCFTNWFQFALRFQDSGQRDAMADFLFSRGIDTAKYLDSIAEEARAQYGYPGDCPEAERLAKTVLLVPIHYNLRTRDIEHIAHSINEGARRL